MSASTVEPVRAEMEARILVVDDEAEIAALVADILREANPSWHVVAESDGRKALERIDTERYDCLITDLVMPHVGGIALAQEAQARDEDLVVIALTGRATLKDGIEAIRSGFVDFLQKPIDLESLAETVSRTLKRRRERAERRRRLDELAQAKTDLEKTQAQLQQKLQIASHDLVLSTKRLVRQMDDVALVADAAKALLGVIELEDLMGLGAELVADRVWCRSSTIALYEPHEAAIGLMVRTVPDSDDLPALCWLREPIRSGIMCRAAQAAKTVHVDDLAHSNLAHGQEKEFWRDGRLLVVPIPLPPDTVVGLAVLHREGGDPDFAAQDVKNLAELVKVIGPAIRTAKVHHRQRCQVYAAVEAIADGVEARDPFMKGHSARVLAYTMPVAMTLELSQTQIGALQIAARLHDIGRIVVPESVANHPGPLSEQQWAVMKRHPVAGADFLKPLDFFGEVGQMIRAHHESYDGTGYPDLKAGEEIPLVARIIAAADALDAMTSPRPYRQAMEMEEAIRQMTRLAGQQFDPQVVQALVGTPMDILEQIRSSGR